MGTNKAPEYYYGFHITKEGATLVNDKTFDSTDEPSNYKETMAGPEAAKWKETMESEIQSIYDNYVWELVDHTPGRTTVGNKWIFKNKTDMDGNVYTFKARLVAKGYTQTQRIDYDETFPQVAKIKSIRILLAMVAFHDYEIWQMDVKTAFLNGKLNEDVYIAQPEGFVHAKYLDKKFNMSESKKGYLPMQHGIRLSKNQCPSTSEELDRMSRIPYASAIGSIMYAMTCTRLDVSFALRMVSRYQRNPGESHWTTVKNILKYLRRTKDVFLVYGGKDELRVTGYTDASFQTDWDDSRSQLGWVFLLNGGAVTWKSSKQDTVADFTCESEYIAASETAKEAA
ncbi:hypothetical protein OSB04_020132 [Centaurea solstitialis]|uniref:Reverse transcriptase Ty1/copia-type domain-containing protein n=1 Tax=Centaurea solstitialis TaxID=347529 RepID=A0AA38SRM9_9ASTR|nr:hypothetical protein OSB04_020132 [Centaurea solstitialis]